jgi:hypothetical protein
MQLSSERQLQKREVAKCAQVKRERSDDEWLAASNTIKKFSSSSVLALSLCVAIWRHRWHSRHLRLAAKKRLVREPGAAGAVMWHHKRSAEGTNRVPPPPVADPRVPTHTQPRHSPACRTPSCPCRPLCYFSRADIHPAKGHVVKHPARNVPTLVNQPLNSAP